MLLLAATVLEGLAGLRALARMATTFGGSALAPSPPAAAGSIDAIVPVLNEERRLAPALAALAACGPSLGTILVVDGGSTDRTRDVVLAARARDSRIRLVDAGLPGPGWNGKAWNLAAGLALSQATWIATIDADVRIGAGLLDAAVARAQRDRLVLLSVATRQELADIGAALLHPALLTTLVYRAGLPNVVTGDPGRVQANGQVMVASRETLRETGALAAARASRCEDVTIARTVAASGARVGFFEGDATVRMHDSGAECAANWPRSLTLLDGFVGRGKLAFALAEVLFAQALPLPTLALIALDGGHAPYARTMLAIAVALVAMRLGVLAGTRRAYPHAPPAYWLSPLADLPAVALVIASALRRTHRWRGRTLVTEGVA
ncbi:glycosyl transferase [Vulcanimicrobium alpinum]|uniref:4,4'-diaponeurosporenoate glycosyltransferase n=1 Tax=Vulcanimicrobium alpinum TaxID=3016050 RepID=A0AAN2CAD5_UNVUL|nr:glycosyltransferase family 2 protein [Vulcanimicrobium alpinum]BDE06808.1 glycosyl transferase [Vulcanimicrobium alpinum]